MFSPEEDTENVIIMPRINNYMIIRAAIITTISLSVYTWLLFTCSIEGSSIDGHEFVACGINYCVRTYNSGEQGTMIKHQRSSAVFNMYLLIIMCMPSLFSILFHHIIAVASMLTIPIGMIPVYVWCNDIVTDENLMGIETNKRHLYGRYILLCIILFPITVTLVELFGAWMIEKIKKEWPNNSIETSVKND